MGTIYRNGKVNTIIKNGKIYGFAESGSEVIFIDRLIPRMTSNTTPSGECSASYVYSGRYAYYGFSTNGNGYLDSGSTFWLNDSSNINEYLQYEFDTKKTIYKIGFGVISSNFINKSVKFQFSDDGINFIDGDTVTPDTYDWTWYELSIPQYCKIFRIVCLNNNNYVISGVDACGYNGKVPEGKDIILKGTTTPTSAQGNNGQIYLKYKDYSTLYDFYEYLEVGNTQGAYINTGVACTSNAYFEVDFNFTGSHSESRVFGCGHGGGAMFLIQNYQIDYVAVGTDSVSSSYQLTDASNRHKYKANDNGIYIDDVLVSTDVYWDRALPERHYNLFAIDWDGTNYYATNARVYSCKIWNGNTIVRHFLPAMRKSDNAIGMLDIISGTLYTNDGSGSFNIGGNIIDAQNIIIETFVKVNNSWQSLIGSDINDIGNVTESLTPIDMSTFTQYRQRAMLYIAISNMLASTWDGNTNIGATCYITNPINVTNINKLYYELETKNCYGNGSTAQQANWNIMIGLMQTAPSDIISATYDSAGFAAGDNFANSNTNYGTQEIDVSNLTGNYYFTFVSHGWNASISNLRYE